MTFETATKQADFKEILALLFEVMSKGYFVRLTVSKRTTPNMFKAEVGHFASHPRLVVTISHAEALEALSEAYKQCQGHCFTQDEQEIKRCAKCDAEASVFQEIGDARFPWHCQCTNLGCAAVHSVSGMERQDVIDRWNKAQSK